MWYVSTSFGPGIGFVAGGSLLNVYVDLIQVCPCFHVCLFVSLGALLVACLFVYLFVILFYFVVLFPFCWLFVCLFVCRWSVFLFSNPFLPADVISSNP